MCCTSIIFNQIKAPRSFLLASAVEITKINLVSALCMRILKSPAWKPKQLLILNRDAKFFFPWLVMMLLSLKFNVSVFSGPHLAHWLYPPDITKARYSCIKGLAWGLVMNFFSRFSHTESALSNNGRPATCMHNPRQGFNEHLQNKELCISSEQIMKSVNCLKGVWQLKIKHNCKKSQVLFEQL